MRTFAIGLLLASVATTALAQTTPPAANPPTPQPAAPTSSTPTPPAPPAAAQPASGSSTATSLQTQITSDLKNAGYTDITVQPGSYIAQAKNKGGDPVTLLIGPGSVTEIVMGDTVPTGTASSPASTGSDMFTTVPAGDGLSSQVVGTSVTNKDNKDIGTIKDVAFSPQGAVKAYIVGVGGFLGVGDRYVAVRPSAVKLTWNANEKRWRATMDTDADSLKKAPEFKYPS